MTNEIDLAKEFHKYRTSRRKHLTKVNLDAIRHGFRRAWIDRDYRSIVDVARKLPNEVFQEDERLQMYYDLSMTRLYG